MSTLGEATDHERALGALERVIGGLINERDELQAEATMHAATIERVWDALGLDDHDVDDGGDPADYVANVVRARDKAETEWRGWRDEANALRVERDELLTVRDDLLVRLDGIVAAMVALADKWHYKGEFGWGPWQEGYGPDPEGHVLDACAGELGAIVAAVKSGASS